MMHRQQNIKKGVPVTVAAYQSHTSRLTVLWFLPKLAQGLNTNNNKPVTGRSYKSNDYVSYK
jgi:hypothetical protein